MARENCTLYRDKFITDCNENCYRCCNRLYSRYVKPNASTAAIENSITLRLPDAANAAKGFYYTDEKYSKTILPEYKLTINAKDIIIKDGKISITIDEDGIDEFNVIEINGIKFVKEDN